jgi:tetratricopeptide (TPR) repeat protein
MAIRGNLNEASLPDVLQLLAMGNKTGTLSLNESGLTGTICFDNGRICHAAVAGRSLGTDDAVFVMFKWNDGLFSFEPGVHPPEGARMVSLDPQGLLLEGARRVDEWSLIEKKIPSFDIVFALDRQQLLRNSIALSEEQQKLLPLIDGFRDIHALMRVSKLGEFDMGKALFGLLSGAFVVPVGYRAAATPVVAETVIGEHRNLGIAFYKARMYSDASREFKRITELRPNDGSAAFYLGLIAAREGRWNDAVTSFQRAAVSAPRASAVLINMSYAYERLGQIEKARLALDLVISRSKGPEPLAHLGLASLALQRGDLDGAARSLESARAAWGGNIPPAAWFHYAGLEASMRGNAERAAELLTAGVASYPSSAVLLNNLSVAQEATGNFEGARRSVERAAQTDCVMPQLYRNLGDALGRQGRAEEAQAAYTRAAMASAGNSGH